MSYLLRVILPDHPGSLGFLATAIGSVGADIISVDIVDRVDGLAIDDIVVSIGPGRPPDEIMSAAESIDGVQVESIRPFDGALATHRELALIEGMSEDPVGAVQLLLDEIPWLFRSGWGVLIDHRGDILLRSTGAPDAEKVSPWTQLDRARLIDPAHDPVPEMWTTLDTTLMGAPSGESFCVVAGRPGGPDFRPSEVARLAHLVGIARTIFLRHEETRQNPGRGSHT